MFPYRYIINPFLLSRTNKVCIVFGEKFDFVLSFPWKWKHFRKILVCMCHRKSSRCAGRIWIKFAMISYKNFLWNMGSRLHSIQTGRNRVPVLGHFRMKNFCWSDSLYPSKNKMLFSNLLSLERLLMEKRFKCN